jgi:uncharacterized protein YjbI with pentapeptide repeats
MGTILELPPIKARPARRRQGLRKLSPDLVGKARDETATQVTRIGLTFLGTTAFCLLSLLSPDSALLGGSEKINVPLAGPVSFIGFMLLGPAVLIALRFYLQLYVEHSARLDRLARSAPVVRTPTFIPLDNPVIRLFSGLIFYALLPVTILLFAWKAAVFPTWSVGLFGAAVAVIVSHVTLPTAANIVSDLNTWRSKVLLSISVAIIALVVMLAFGPPSRPFNLFRANLSDQWLVGENLREANLAYANLSRANLSRANLRRANLSGADLNGANLGFANLGLANLSGANLGLANLGLANLSGANLSGANLGLANLGLANLSGANLIGADLHGADLNGAKLISADLSRANLSGAKLIGANLIGAKLISADLSRASLSGANLGLANLIGANLVGAGLNGADLHDADLNGANLNGANLNGADLHDADLNGANLHDARNLIQTQLDEACGNESTSLPKGLTLKPCPSPP